MKSIVHTYSLTEQHIMIVKQIAEETGLSEGLVVRNVIDLLKEHYVRMGKLARGHIFRETIEDEIPTIHRVTRISDLIEI